MLVVSVSVSIVILPYLAVDKKSGNSPHHTGIVVLRPAPLNFYTIKWSNNPFN